MVSVDVKHHVYLLTQPWGEREGVGRVLAVEQVSFDTLVFVSIFKGGSEKKAVRRLTHAVTSPIYSADTMLRLSAVLSDVL